MTLSKANRDLQSPSALKDMATIEITESPFWGQIFSMNDFSLSSTAFSVNLYVKNGENLEPNTSKIKNCKVMTGNHQSVKNSQESSSGFSHFSFVAMKGFNFLRLC